MNIKYIVQEKGGIFPDSALNIYIRVIPKQITLA